MLHKSFNGWWIAGAVSFLLIPTFWRWEKSVYQKTEPTFSNPLSTTSRALSLRSDCYGKGFFGASRNGGRKHMGIDLSAPIGNSVFAAKSGRVTFAGEEKNGYGKYVEILHPDTRTSCYAHLSELNVQTGDWASKNRLIGSSGNSGNAKNSRISPHLHFEIRRKNQAVDPGPLLDPTIQILR